ncbi:MAG TPA: hypothetical protein VGB83_05760 [Actinomycetota bacterium]
MSTSPAAARPALARWAKRLSPAHVMGFVVLASILTKNLSARLGDPDLWWHLRTGRLIVEDGFPRTDVYSFTAYGDRWVTQEWGPEVLFHALRETFGLYGIVWYRALVLFAVYAVVARLVVRRMGHGLGTWALITLTAYAGTTNWTERPNLLSYLLFVITLAILQRKSARVWWIVPLTAVWANLHGMVLLGIGLVALTAATEGLKSALRWDGADGAHARRLGLVTGAAVLATFANPSGPGLIAHGFGLIQTVVGLVTEWASPNFHALGTQAFLLLILITVAALVMSPERPDPLDLAYALAFIVLGLQAVRNLALASIVLGFVCAGYLPGALSSIPRRARAARRQEVGDAGSVALGVAGLAVAIVGLAIPVALWYPRSSAIGDVVEDTYPVAAIDALDRPGTCLFVADFWSGMVIDRTWPNVHLYMDLRQDVYGRARAQRYLRTLGGYPEWRENLDDAGVTHALVKPTHPLAQLLEQDGGWRLTRQDELSVTYERRDPSIRCSVPPRG